MTRRTNSRHYPGEVVYRTSVGEVVYAPTAGSSTRYMVRLRGEDYPVRARTLAEAKEDLRDHRRELREQVVKADMEVLAGATIATLTAEQLHARRTELEALGELTEAQRAGLGLLQAEQERRADVHQARRLLALADEQGGEGFTASRGDLAASRKLMRAGLLASEGGHSFSITEAGVERRRREWERQPWIEAKS